MSEFYLLGNSSASQMFGCVFKTETKTIVIDGGTIYDCDQMITFLKENANSCVDAWFFTHPHHDHIGCFVKLRSLQSDIKIKKVYHCFPSKDLLIKNGMRASGESELWDDIDKWNATILSVGDSFVFDDITVRVLRTFNPDIIANFVNNSSAVYRIENKNKSFLILGDLGVEGGNEVIENVPIKLLQTDYTQMAHHGQNGVNKSFYEYIKPKACIWPTPDWLWNNDGGGGFNTGHFKTLDTRKWVEELGVTEHFIEKDGTQKIFF